MDWDGDSPWRPFCSERCKSVDLGGWLQESHRIPGIELPEELLDEIGDEQDPANQ